MADAVASKVERVNLEAGQSFDFRDQVVCQVQHPQVAQVAEVLHLSNAIFMHVKAD